MAKIFLESAKGLLCIDLKYLILLYTHTQNFLFSQMLNTYSTRIYNNRIYRDLPHLETYRIHFCNLSFARQRCVARIGESRRLLLSTTAYFTVPFALARLLERRAGAPVGTRVWTRRKPRELSSTGSLVLMYIPSVGGKYWFYFADMTTICHQAPCPFVYTHIYVRVRARDDSRASREAEWNAHFMVNNKEGPRPVSREVV